MEAVESSLQRATEILGLTEIGVAKCSVLSDKAIDHALSKGTYHMFSKFFDLAVEYSKKNNLPLSWTNFYSYVNSLSVVDPKPVFMVPPKAVKKVEAHGQSAVDSQERMERYRESREEMFQKQQAIAKERYMTRRAQDPEFAAKVKMHAAELPEEIRKGMAEIDPFFQDTVTPAMTKDPIQELLETKQMIADMKHMQDMLSGLTVNNSTHIGNHIKMPSPDKVTRHCTSPTKFESNRGMELPSSFDDGPPLVPDYSWQTDDGSTLVIR